MSELCGKPPWAGADPCKLKPGHDGPCSPTACAQQHPGTHPAFQVGGPGCTACLLERIELLEALVKVVAIPFPIRSRLDLARAELRHWLHRLADHL